MLICVVKTKLLEFYRQLGVPFWDMTDQVVIQLRFPHAEDVIHHARSK